MEETKTSFAKITNHIANSRSNFLHKSSAKISKNHDMIILEDLKISNLSKVVQGDTDKHGTNIKPKSGLNKSILDQGWFEFRKQLEYKSKSKWLGGDILVVNPRNTSRTCLSCSHISKDNRTTQAEFECV